MATPNLAQLTQTLQQVVHLYDEARKFAEDNGSDDVVSIQAAIETGGGTGLVSNNADGITAGVFELRAALSAFLTDSSPLDAHLLDWADFLDTSDTDTGRLIDRIFEYFVDNTISLQTRAFTFGSPAAAVGNTGNGTIIRLNTDWNSQDIENQSTGDKKATCLGDANTDDGAERNAELFLFETGATARDAVEEKGTGLEKTIQVISPNLGLLGNPSFDSFQGTASAPTGIPSWTSSISVETANFEFETGDPNDAVALRPRAGVTPYSLRIKANCVLTQSLDEIGARVNRFIPYYARVHYSRDTPGGSAGSGTLAIGMGSISNSVVVAAETDFDNVLDIVASPDQTLWYRNFVEENLDFTITVSGLGGDINIDDVIFAGMTNFDGAWYVVLPGATPFRAGTIEDGNGDSFTWTDSATESIIQRWFWRHYGRYLPHSATPSIADP